MQARVAFYGQFAFEEYKVCDGVQENNEGGGKFFEWGRVLDFAVCLRLLVVEVSAPSGLIVLEANDEILRRPSGGLRMTGFLLVARTR